MFLQYSVLCGLIYPAKLIIPLDCEKLRQKSREIIGKKIENCDGLNKTKNHVSFGDRNRFIRRSVRRK